METEFIISLSGKEWTCRCLRSEKRKRTISLQVLDTEKLFIQAPTYTSMTEIRNFIHEKERWIWKQINRLIYLPPEIKIPKYYEGGAIQRFLGEAYPVEWVKCPPRSKKVVLSENRLWVLSSTNETLVLQKEIHQWYRNEFSQRCEEEIEKWSSMLPWVETTPPFTIRNVKMRWGSCSSQKTLSFNVHLVKFSMEIVSYVICHELCHLKEMNHTSHFYALLDEYLPAWKKHRNFLKKFKETQLTLF